MRKGLDISSHQPSIDFQQVKDAGYDFVVIKITGGNQYINPYWRRQMNGALAVGLQCGFYHYDGEPTVSTGTPQQEAAFFLANLPSPLPQNCFLALDAEERATRDPQRYFVWLEIIRKSTGEIPFLYTFLSFITELGADAWTVLKDYPLWYAWYPDQISPLGDPPRPPAPWTKYLAWQYSGGTAIPGIPNPTDADAFYGTVEELSSDDPTFPGRTDKTPVAQHAEGFLEPIRDVFDWGGAGIVTYRKIQVYNDLENKWFEREWFNQSGFTDWKELKTGG